MSGKIDIHNYETMLASIEKRIKESSEISESDKMALLDFENECITEGMSLARITKNLSTLLIIARMLNNDFESAQKSDVQDFIKKIESREDYSDWTKHDYKVIIKRFFKWLRKTEDYPPEVKWIKATIKNNRLKLPDQLLTEEDVKKIINSADNPRDKAIVSMLYESGCRIGEILTLRLKHIQPVDYGFQVVVNGKTGMRRLRLIASFPYLNLWMNMHSLKDDPEAPLWLDRKENKLEKKHMNYSGVCMMLKRLARKAGINKRVHPHLFRHSRATFLAKHLTEAQMKEFFGWRQNSDMASIYVHLSGRDVDDALLKLYGIKKEEDEKIETKLKPKECPRCGEPNPPEAKSCHKCWGVLDVQSAIQIDKEVMAIGYMVKEIMKGEPELEKMFKDRMVEKFSI